MIYEHKNFLSVCPASQPGEMWWWDKAGKWCGRSVTNSAWVQNTAAAEIRRNTKSHSAVKKGCRGHPPKMMPQAVKYLQIQVFCIMSHSMEGLREENKTKRLRTVTSGSVKCIWCKNGQDHQRQWKPEVGVWWCEAAWQKVLGRQRHKWHLIGGTVNAWGYTKILTADVWQNRGLFQPGDVSKHTAKITRDSKERKKKKKLCPVQVWGLFKSKRSLLGYFQEPQSNSASAAKSSWRNLPFFPLLFLTSVVFHHHIQHATEGYFVARKIQSLTDVVLNVTNILEDWELTAFSGWKI